MRRESPLTPVPDDSLPGRVVLSAGCAAAFVLAVLGSSQIQLSMIDHGHDWWRLFAWQLAGWGFWGLTAPWIVRAGAGLLRPESRPPHWLPRETAKALLLTAVHLPLVAVAFTLLQPYLPVGHYSLSESLVRTFRSWFHLDLLIYCLGLAIGYGLAGYREARRSELRESRLETELARAQLESLRLQIQPHFLFNTLHSIAALVRRRSNDRALEMLLGLSELLRSTLERSEESRIPFSEELAFVRFYVDLQQARFADRLTVDYDVAECLEQPVPTLLLQPLVENAIRHGISKRAAPGRIEIRARVATDRIEGDRLVLEVADDGGGLPEGFDPATDEGVGLGNTRSRLRHLYGERAALTLRDRDAGGVIATVSLPAERQPAEAVIAPQARAAAG